MPDITFFAHAMLFWIFTLILTVIVIPRFKLNFLLSNLHLHSHDICFANVFDSFIPVIMLKTPRFESYVLFRTHTLLDRSLRVLQLLIHLSK